MTFSDFAAKHSKDDAFKAIEKMKDRETLFNEYLTDLKKKDKETTKTRHDKVKVFVEGRDSMGCVTGIVVRLFMSRSQPIRRL